MKFKSIYYFCLFLGLYSFNPSTLKAQAEMYVTQNHSEALAEIKKINQEISRLSKIGEYSEATMLAEKSLKRQRKIFINQDPELIKPLNTLGRLYRIESKYIKAEKIYLEIKAIRAQEFGQEHSGYADALNKLAVLYQEQQKYEKATDLFIQAKDIWGRVLGKDHSNYLIALNNLGILYESQQKYSEAEPFYIEAKEIRFKKVGQNDPSYASALNRLAGLYHAQAKYKKAIQLYKEAKMIWGKSLEKSHPNHVITLSNLATIYEAQGHLSKAKSLYIEVVELLKKSQYESDNYATALNNLAGFYKSKGNILKAEQLYLEAKETRKQVLGSDHPNYAVSLNNLALIYELQDRMADVESLYIEAKDIFKKYGRQKPEYIQTLVNLAGFYQSKELFQNSEDLFLEVLDIQGQTIGAQHPDYATTLSLLAQIYYRQERYTDAEPLYLKAKEIRRQRLGPEHPSYANSLNNLAALYQSQGRYAEAVPLYLESKAIERKVLGEKHNKYAKTLKTLGELALSNLYNGDSLSLLSQSLDIEEYNLSRNLVFGNESQKRSHLQQFNGSNNLAISTHINFSPDNHTAKELSLTTILRRKGRALDVLGQSLQKLKRNKSSHVKQKLDEMASLYQQQTNDAYLERKDVDITEFLNRRKATQSKIDQLETELIQLDVDLNREFLPVKIPQISSAIPKNATLIEFARYIPFTVDLSQPEPHYVVYTLNSNGDIRWADLGPASEIDPLVRNYRTALSQSEPQLPLFEIEKISNPLYNKLLKPIEKGLSTSSALLIAPDSQLNVIPFEALLDNQRQYLVQNFQITYLTSGRDLLRLNASPDVKANSPLLIASPDFGPPLSNNLKSSNSQRSIDLQKLTVLPLLNARPEGEALAKLFPQSRALFGAEATEAALKKTSNNARFLHIATHGFFLADDPQQKKLNDIPLFAYENPLLRSGLALAGFNQRQGPEREDGVLSALEVTGLDLRATQLVTLSACRTGLGEIANSEGVYGLRRAFTLAGAKSQIMSLWDVYDPSTKDLMVAYYQRLKNGEGRGEALRNVQIDMINRQLTGKPSERYDHPYYWAAFVRTGDWRPLQD